MSLNVAILGGSGYAGGELLRLLLDHPEVTVTQVTSRSRAGKFVHTVHPNLRKRTPLKFVGPEQLERVDVLFSALPHGETAPRVERLLELGEIVVDLSADFRLSDPAAYRTWYGWAHPVPELLQSAVYGMPELHREELRSARYIASPGCNATASILGLVPLFRAGIVDPRMPLVIEAKTGSSGAGAEVGLSSHHPERSGIIRTFKPTGHRHSAEVLQELTVDGVTPELSFTVTSVEAVRGILATAHVFLQEPLADRDLWTIYRGMYGQEPFIRLVKEAGGLHRYPEPKILSGSNYCDVGWELDAGGKRVVVMSAIDNLMKGAAGQAVQAMNVRCGFDETAGLGFAGLHPL
ncbi:MAG TPA: N-acetyl-gamma-glutamyl-phosphate reductase [Solirubrobacteraceae bacterium]|nr:N-acetyl-gamma-glutamyl-phosphate reductase [Solirubrobacteraceae bacterium]